MLGLDGEQFFVRRFKTRAGQHMESVNTLRHYMTRVLDFWGCPKPSFYRSLIEYTDSPMTCPVNSAMSPFEEQRTTIRPRIGSRLSTHVGVLGVVVVVESVGVLHSQRWSDRESAAG